MTFFEQLAGLCLLAVILLDIFATVLYARAGSGVIAPHAARVLWPVIRSISAISNRFRDGVLSFGGPLLLVTVIGMWLAGLSLGAALVIHPALGGAVQSTSGETPRSFIAALLAGGSSVSIVGSGGFQPRTDTFRLFYLLTSLAGTAVTSLVLTYLMQVYTALLRRNTVALYVDTWSHESGDAVELLARLFPDNQTSAGYNVMVQWATSMASAKEMHHFYPVLCYFRFTDPRYSMARTALVTLDAVALIRTALNPKQFGWVHRSGALEQLDESARMVLDTLAEESHMPEVDADRNIAVLRWKHRVASAIPRLREAGIAVTDDVDAAASEYVRLREGWDGRVNGLADFLGYRREQIDCGTLMPAHGKD